MQEKRHGTARFVLNKEGQLEHLIQIGGYTLHVIVQHQLSNDRMIASKISCVASLSLNRITFPPGTNIET